MDFHLLSDVRNLDGDTLGELRRIVYDPATGRVEYLVVQQADLDGHAVLLPMAKIDSSDDDAVITQLTSDEFAELFPYGFSRNIAPPPADMDPSTASADFEEDPVEVPNVPPIGAASGITSIAFTPIVQEVTNVSDNLIVLDDDTRVRAVDGDMGALEHVYVDDASGMLQSIVVEVGGLFTRAVEVPASAIDSLNEEEITLSVVKRDIPSSEGE